MTVSSCRNTKTVHPISTLTYVVEKSQSTLTQTFFKQLASDMMFTQSLFEHSHLIWGQKVCTDSVLGGRTCDPQTPHLRGEAAPPDTPPLMSASSLPIYWIFDGNPPEADIKEKCGVAEPLT